MIDTKLSTTLLPVSRRCLLGAMLVGLAACSESKPEKADVLDKVADHIRSSYPRGAIRIDNLVFKSGNLRGDGSYEVYVDYDLITVMKQPGLFDGINQPGDREPVIGERYVFVRNDNRWVVK